MANDRDQQNRDKSSVDKKDRNAQGDAQGAELEGKRVIGRGMTSPDSTQVPLRAEDGEPDEDAIRGRVPLTGEDKDESSRR